MKTLILTVVCAVAGWFIVADTVRAFTGSINKTSNAMKVNK